ncbi:sensor histidine kinase [Rhizobium sp. C4]|uniref:sensor histidine kinase n=1 Tax=Rhizobium sp. C4 TaxID=1349800 RepID=UPI001E35D1FF|nr:CHASE3 domain-containing protein [Rhizobium sp. C4]MCD2173393.1 CHASE3 domain-containing protein [Rhizobium sp. C4]
MTINKPFVRNSLVMLFCGSGLLISVLLSAMVLITQTRETFDRLVVERTVRTASSDLFSLLQDAETGQRGYLLTQDAGFLKPYQDAVGQIPQAEERLSKALGKQTNRTHDVAELIGLIDAKMRELNSTVELAEMGDIAAARSTVRAGSGQELMTKIRDKMQAIIGTSDTAIRTNVGKHAAISEWLQFIMIAAFIAIFVVLGGAIYIIMRHVRSLTEARRELMKLNEELEHRVVERTQDVVRANQEIQRYAYIVTHDLRAPLVNIMGFASELDRSIKDVSAYVLADGAPVSQQAIQDARIAVEQDMPEALGFIRSSTSRMDGLINAIRKISRDGRRQLKPEPIDIRDIANSCVSSQQHRIDEAGGEVDLALPSLKLFSDRMSIEQILANLVDNAIKYRSPKRPLKIRIEAVRRGRLVDIIVEDNGRGIEADDLERVFELFRRAGPQDQVGEGIGLAHVRSLARNLGGEIDVRSVPGEGSAFILTTPSDLSQVLRSISA